MQVARTSIAVALLGFLACGAKVNALTIHFLQGGWVESTEYTLPDLVDLSVSLGQTDPRASREILLAIATKNYAKDRRFVCFENPPLELGDEAFWYVDREEVTKEKLLTILQALYAKAPFEKTAIEALMRTYHRLERSEKKRRKVTNNWLEYAAEEIARRDLNVVIIPPWDTGSEQP